MTTQVLPVETEIRWEPNAPEAVLKSSDDGIAVLWLRAHFDDVDQRDVVLKFTGCRSSQLGAPNDEARASHRLFNCGLDRLLWLGEVIESDAVRLLETANRVDPRHDPSSFDALQHWVLPLKECVVEIVATAIEVRRSERIISSVG